MATVEHAEGNRRDFLFLATGATAAVGAAAAVWPFISQLAPDASTVAAGAPAEFDLAPIASGSQIKILWRGKPYFIRNRTEAEIKSAVDTDITKLRHPEPDSARVKAGHAKWLIASASCTHLGCVPLGNQGEFGGWFCPCHGSVFDTSGRIRSGPAPKNLPVPVYVFLSETRVRISGPAVLT